MGIADRRESYLFQSYDDCCARHTCPLGASPNDDPAERITDVVTHADEDFNRANSLDALPWIHGGTSTHVAGWHTTSHMKHTGSRSIRSGDLNGMRGKSSDLMLKLDSSRGGTVEFWYYADVGNPFDYFEFKIDGNLNHRDGMPSEMWQKYELGVAPGRHDISFHLISPSHAVSVDRNIDAFGTGVVYVDNFKFTPSTR